MLGLLVYCITKYGIMSIRMGTGQQFSANAALGNKCNYFALQWAYLKKYI